MCKQYKPKCWSLLHKIPIPPPDLLQEYGITAQSLNDHKINANMIRVRQEWKYNAENFSKCVSSEGYVVSYFQKILEVHTKRGNTISIKLANVSELARTVIKYITDIQSLGSFERRMLSFR